MDKRMDYLSWDEYYMAIALLSAGRSKDPEIQKGVCLVSHDNRILATGYNGAPNGYSDEDFPWKKEGNPLNTKYMYECHAELNTILSYRGFRQDLEGAKMYINLFPCHECAKAIIQTGIKEIIYLYDDIVEGVESNMVSKKIFSECGIKYRKLCSSKSFDISYN
jgi:dCMP deaminase